MMNPKVLSEISNNNFKILNSSKDYNSYIENADTLLVTLQKELSENNYSPKLHQVASISVLISTLFAYGNPIPYSDSVGCLSQNYKSKKTSNNGGGNYDFQLLKENRIGCCTDYAYIMSKFLNFYKYKNRYVLISGHILNEFQVDGKWYMVDANTGILATKSFTSDKSNFQIFYLPHFGMMDSPVYRPDLVTFREFMSNVICDQKIADGIFIKYIAENEYQPY
ncbi:MAG TPA: hypothetical protein VEV44_18475 [Pseudoneobacillus sp.]|nr:hypothetical protein [Pseudoneobacillus sp.]